MPRQHYYPPTVRLVIYVSTHFDPYVFDTKTLCPSSPKGGTQLPLAQAAWLQIPQMSFYYSVARECGALLSNAVAIHVALNAARK